MQAPLLWWLTLYCTGLLQGISNESIGLIAIPLIILLIVFTPIVRRADRVHVLAYAWGFFCLGSLSMDECLPSLNAQLVGTERYYIGTLEEQIRESEDWSTNSVRIDCVRQVSGHWSRVDEKVALISETGDHLFREGDRLLFQTKLEVITPRGNPGEFNPEGYWLSKGIRYTGFTSVHSVKIISTVEPGFWNRLFEAVHSYSSALIDKYVGGQHGALVRALLLGDKTALSSDTKQSFADTGAMHMLAVSGLHVGIVAYLLNGLFQFIFHGVKRRYSIILLLLILWFYAFLTGFSPSVTRAVLMFSVLIAAQLAHRRYNALNALSLAAFILLVHNPLVLFDLGFQLSFLAMLGIFTVYPLLEQTWKSPNKWVQKLWQGTAVGLAAQVFTVPLSLYSFHQFPNYFALTNLGIMAFSGIILGCAIGLLVIGKIPYVRTFFGWILVGVTSLLFYFIQWVESVPGAVAYGFDPGKEWLILMYCAIVGALALGSRFRWMYLVPLVMVFPLQWQRNENLGKKEVLVFNTNHFTLLVNNGTHQVCLYTGAEKGLKRAKFLVGDYAKIHPGRANFIPIEKEACRIRMTGQSICVTRRAHGFSLSVNDKQFFVVTSNRFQKEDEVKTSLIFMPSIQRNRGVLLAQGAWRLPLH